MFKVETENGKNTFINDNGVVTVMRNGELWEEGDKVLLTLLQKVERYENALKSIAEETGTPCGREAIEALNDNE